ncbi:MAG: hypothetical protein ABI876_08600 [Bacteroidota bacterium]
MNIYFSDFFRVSPDDLDRYGAFDVSLINDLPLFVDPFLLFNSEKGEHRKLHDEILRYVGFLRGKADTNIRPGLIDYWFTFPEVRQNWFGYSMKGNRGSGLGKDFARALNQNLQSIFHNFGNEAITRSSHIEKLCLIKDGIGRDNISDFTVNLIKGYLVRYTSNFAEKYIESKYIRKVLVEKVLFNYDTETWGNASFNLPYVNGDYVLLTPKEILTKDEMWINRHDLVGDFENIARSIPNEQLRDSITNYFLRTLPKSPKKKDYEYAASRTIDQYPEVLDFFILQKEDNGDRARDISEERVRDVERIFISRVRDLVENRLAPLGFYRDGHDSYDASMRRVQFLKNVIENQDGYRLFYVDGKPIQRELDLQIIFRLTWYATIYDVNREVNNGRGPVDYKISSGSKDKALVEFKLASNSKLKTNLQNQVAVYEKANDTKQSIKVILFFNDVEEKKTRSILNELGLSGNPDVVLIDARRDNKPSASNA